MKKGFFVLFVVLFMMFTFSALAKSSNSSQKVFDKPKYEFTVILPISTLETVYWNHIIDSCTGSIAGV